MSPWTPCTLLLALVSAQACDIDGGYGIDSTVEIQGIGDLSYAPVFVQGFAPEDLLADGTPSDDAIPVLEIVTAGAMKDSPALPLGYGSLGYPTELAFIAWVDVDGDTFGEAFLGS